MPAKCQIDKSSDQWDYGGSDQKHRPEDCVNLYARQRNWQIRPGRHDCLNHGLGILCEWVGPVCMNNDKYSEALIGVAY